MSSLVQLLRGLLFPWVWSTWNEEWNKNPVGFVCHLDRLNCFNLNCFNPPTFYSSPTYSFPWSPNLDEVFIGCHRGIPLKYKLSWLSPKKPKVGKEEVNQVLRIKLFSGVTSTFFLTTQCAMQTGRFCIWVQTFEIPTPGQPIHDNSIQFWDRKGKLRRVAWA